ncbi:zinc finger protein mnm-2-like [Teleopsis dalmanni]|uniref:zinc finger protein mnm-2-like n=1 Tax=Teleopsis dalmanni TaxID=139649 RepID=UPI0018CD9C98|nr:zinc finger protein mnm-2-like [Teleopsis dalmanni]
MLKFFWKSLFSFYSAVSATVALNRLGLVIPSSSSPHIDKAKKSVSSPTEKRRSRQRRTRQRFSSPSLNKKLKCITCDKTYGSTYTLTRHQRVECQKLPMQECDFCHRYFYYRRTLKKHVENLHDMKFH